MPRISQETIDKVAAANDIVDVIGSYIPLKRAGSAFRCLCPFHREKTPSFNVNPQKQIFHCFGCGAGGSVIRFVTMYENLDFVSAVRKLADRAGIVIVEDVGERNDEADDFRMRLMKLHSEVSAWFHDNLMSAPEAAHAREYLRRRGIGRETAVAWQLGYAPDSMGALVAWARRRKIPRQLLVAAGLVKEREEGRAESGVHDRFRDRIVFPIYNDSGSPIAFSGRTLKSEPKIPKYLNSPETPIFVKGRVLFGLHKSKRPIIDADEAIVLEGQLDLITCFEAGIQNVVAPQGTAFTPEQARLLRRYAGGVTLCFDSDTAGQNAAEKSFPALLEANLAVKVARLPAGEDPDSLVRGSGAEAFREHVRQADDFFGFLIRRIAGGADMSDARVKVATADRLATSISLLSDPVLRDDAVRRSAATLGISAGEFQKKLKAPGPKAREDVELRVETDRIRPPEAVHILCLLALHSAAARAWLRAQPWRETLGSIPEARPLEVIMTGLLDDEETGTTAFIASQGRSLESYLAGLLSERPPADALGVAREWWQRFVLQARLRNRQKDVEQLVRANPPDWQAISHAKKEILDLQLQLRQLAPL